MSTVFVRNDHGIFVVQSEKLMAFLQHHYSDVNATLATLRRYTAGVCGHLDLDAYAGEDSVTCAAAVIDSGNYSLQDYSIFCSMSHCSQW